MKRGLRPREPHFPTQPVAVGEPVLLGPWLGKPGPAAPWQRGGGGGVILEKRSFSILVAVPHLHPSGCSSHGIDFLTIIVRKKIFKGF